MFFAQQLDESLDCGLNSRRSSKRFSIGAATLCCRLIQAAAQEGVLREPEKIPLGQSAAGLIDFVDWRVCVSDLHA